MRPTASGDNTQSGPTRPTILVVEDSDDMGELIASALEDEGYQVQRATTGEAAIRLARTTWPDLMTLDVGLPDGSGLDVIRALRDDPVTASILVIAVSAYAVEANGELSSLVTRVLPKPFYVSELVDAIALVLSSEVAPGTA